MYLLQILLLLISLFSIALSLKMLENAANLIISNRQSGNVQQSFEDIDKISIDDGYQIQKMIMNSGQFGRIVGWKMGATNKAAQEGLSIIEPFYGPLFEQHKLSNNDHVSLKSISKLIAAEAEFLFIMKNDLKIKEDNSDYSEEEVFNNVEYICPSIEIASIRFATIKAGIFIGDCAANGIFLYDHMIKKSDINDYKLLCDAIASIEINDIEVCRNTGTNVLGNPITSLTFLANKLNKDGNYLKAGDVILSGAATAHKTLKAGDKLVVKFNKLLKDELSLTLFIDE